MKQLEVKCPYCETKFHLQENTKLACVIDVIDMSSTVKSVVTCPSCMFGEQCEEVAEGEYNMGIEFERY